MGAALYSRRGLSKMRTESGGATRRSSVSNRMKTALIRKVVQISTMVHLEKDWAFIALCEDGSLWFYHDSMVASREHTAAY
jgi:hypothetical protein